MMKSLAAFAKSGDPNNASLGVTWPVWPGKLLFDATKTTKVIDAVRGGAGGGRSPRRR